MSQRPGCGAGIRAIAAATPPGVRDNAWFADKLLADREATNQRDPIAVVDLDTRDSFDPEVLEKFHEYADDPFRGGSCRHVLDPDQPPLTLEVQAARQALDQAGLNPSDIDLLIVYSQRPDWVVPKNHGLIAEELGIPRGAYTIEAGADFCSLLVQLWLASTLVAAGAHRNALVVYSHAVTPLFEPNTVAGAVVGDSAVAAVIGPVPDGLGIIDKRQITRGDLHAMLRLTARSDAATPWYSPEGAGAAMRAMDPGAARIAGGRSMSLCREACLPLLEDNGYRPDDVALFCCGEPAVWFAKTAAESMGIPATRAPSSFASHGRAMNEGLNLVFHAESLDPGDVVLMYAPSPGFLQSALLLRWATPAARQ